MALLDFVEKIHEALDKGEYTIGVFLALAKAFDSKPQYFIKQT